MTGTDRQHWSCSRHVLAALLLFAIVAIPRFWAASRAVAPARDAFRYWSAAACLSEFPLSFSIPAIDCQPLYPATLAGIGSLAFSMDPEDCWRRAQAWSILCAAWFYWAAYAAGLRLFTPGIAWLGCSFVSLLPRQIRYSVDVLSDNLHAALWMTALALLVWSWDRQTRRANVLIGVAGVVTALAYWTRFESLLLPSVFLFAMLARQCFESACLPLGNWSARVACYVLPISLAIGGYWHLRGDFAARQTVHAVIGSVNREERAKSTPSALAALNDFQMAPSIEEPRTPMDRWLTQSGQPTTLLTLVVSFTRVLWELLQETRGWLGVLFVMGLAGVRQSARGGGTGWLIAVVFIAYGVMLTIVRWKVGFLAGRYWMPVLPLLGMIAASAVIDVWQRFRAKSVAGDRAGRSGITSTGLAWAWCASIAILAVGLSLPAWMEPLHAARSGHRQAARWLAEHLKPDESVFDPSWACGFFAERPLWHPITSEIPECQYAVIEPAVAARPPAHLQKALDYVAGEGRILAEFPKQTGKKEIGVRIVVLPTYNPATVRKSRNEMRK